MKKLLKLFSVFFRIGAFTFGGGYAMIPLMEREIVTKNQWISEKDIIDIFAVAQTVPGAVAINSSTFIGFKIAGYWGAIFATLGVILPSFIIILLIAALFTQFKDLPVVNAAFSAIRATVVALIALAAIKIGKAAIKDWAGIIIACGTLFLLLVLELHAIAIIVMGAASGLLMYYVRKKLNKTEGGQVK